MRKILNTIPNQLSGLRILLVPILWVFAIVKLPVYIGIGLAIEFLTDVLDGRIARKTGQVTEFGSKLDTWADTLVGASSLVWLVMLKPEIIENHLVIVVGAVALNILHLGIGVIKHKRFGNTHLFSSKLASVMAYLFLIHTFIFPDYSLVLFYMAFGAYILTSLENTLLLLISSKVDEHIVSVIPRLSRKLQLKN